MSTKSSDQSDDDVSSVQSFHSCCLPDDSDREEDVVNLLTPHSHSTAVKGIQEELDLSVEFIQSSKLPIPRLSSKVQVSLPQRSLFTKAAVETTVEAVSVALMTGASTKQKKKRIVLDDDSSLSSDGEDVGEHTTSLDNKTLSTKPDSYLSGDEATGSEDENNDELVKALNEAAVASSSEPLPRVFTFEEFSSDEEEHDQTKNSVQNEKTTQNVATGKGKGKFMKDPIKGDWVLHGLNVVKASEIRLPREIGDFLYDYQREGVEFLLRSWDTECGGAILADDMGMGKTNQAVAALAALFYSLKAKRALVVVPLSVLDRWKTLLVQWVGPYCSFNGIQLFHGPKKDMALKSVSGDRGGVLLTTYETCQSRSESLKMVRWDCFLADEASKIKNHKSGLSKAVRCLASVSKRRACLTGTPFENSLAELWALFDFACDGKLLGSFADFNRHFAGRIERSQLVGGEGSDMIVGTQLSKGLHAVIAPFLLRREKTMFFQSVKSTDEQGIDRKVLNEQEIDHKMVVKNPSIVVGMDKKEGNDETMREEMRDLPKENRIEPVHVEDLKTVRLPEFRVRKVDVLVWIHLSSVQRDLYKSFLESNEVALALNRTQSPLAAITVLKKICDDARLLIGTHRTEPNNNYSNKLQVLMTLLEELAINGGHKIIVFSHSKRMIDFMEQAVRELGSKRREQTLACLRVDGDIKAADRVKLIRSFNRDEETGDKSKDDWFDGKWDVLFLTSGVGALGIEVTGADRVIIFDPHWNPAVDDQAIDRAFRIGQKRNVVCYRFVTVGTVEEKMTRIQVRKTSLARAILKAETQRAYSSLEDLKDLFTLGDPDADDRLYRILLQAEDGSMSISESVRETLKDCAKPAEVAEVVAQVEALHSCDDDENDREDDIHPLRRALVHTKIVASVSDRSRLFSSNDAELEQTLRDMSLDDKKAVTKVVEDAMGWLMTKESTDNN